MRPIMLMMAALAFAGCADREIGRDEQDVTVDTEEMLAWRQHQANRRFAEAYVPRCRSTSTRPRVLVTGFGRFRGTLHNATGHMVTRLLDGMEYPLSPAPAEGEVDAPGPQLEVRLGTIESPTLGEVDVCAMVLPVFWDLAGTLVLREADAFGPDLVIMNGIAGSTQPLWIEMGAVNAVGAGRDGSDRLAPLNAGDPILDDAAWARPNLGSWSRLRDAATRAIGAVDAAGDAPLGTILTGAQLAGFPRVSNDYLCNNTTYLVGYGLDHVGEPLRLMEASHPRLPERAAIEVTMTRDLSSVPRFFVHWPSRLVDQDAPLDGASSVLWSLVETQLTAIIEGSDLPTPGDNALADKPADTTGGG